MEQQQQQQHRLHRHASPLSHHRHPSLQLQRFAGNESFVLEFEGHRVLSNGGQHSERMAVKRDT